MKRERIPFSWRPRVLATRWWYEFHNKRRDLPWFKRVRRRFLLWLPIAVPAILILGGLSLYVGIGLRARYLVSEGMRSIEEESFARGYRQIMVAHSLRPGDPAVRRAWTYVRSRTNDEAMLPEWTAIAVQGELTPMEAKEHARLLLVYGKDAEFEAAISVLEAMGETGAVAGLRWQHAAKRGDYTNAVTLAREAVTADDEDGLRYELLRLLLLRYGPSLLPPAVPSEEDDRAMEEILAITERLRGTKLGPRAVALALTGAPIPPTTAWAWAQEALQDRTSGNLALLPAADVAIQSEAADAATLAAEFRPVFADGPLDRRADFAYWLNRYGQAAMVLDLISADEAVIDSAAYAARAEALISLGQWQPLFEMSAMESEVPMSLRLGTRAVAARQLGQDSLVPDLVAQSLDHAVREELLEETVSALDLHDESPLVDDILLGLCARRDAAPQAYPLARARFKGRGDEETVLKALNVADEVVPEHVAVLDSRRRRELLAGHPVDPVATAAAVATAPANVALRLTHALALAKAGRYDEALAVFDYVDVFVTELTPGEQAILYAVLQGVAGQSFNAARLSAAIDRSRLTPEEMALLEGAP
jgi:tetratricopeptide (TPR) repeat protein